MPHLLVAGSTGSGKSVAINAMVTSLLYRHSPRDLRLILVDPKMLELNVYEHIPHLLVPVVTNPAKAAAALKWAVDEMERRYYLLSQMRVRNIDSYNKALEENQQAGDEQALASERLPYIVIVIDEFADLMMVASKDVEMCVTRLAQKARAAGVHLILATQRPSVDVITGLIKANFPTRISFKVFSKIDSRTVLDTSGAEALLGMGDMLFRPPGRGDLQRVHGAYVDEKEIEQVVHVLKEQESPNYQEEILVVAESGEFDPGVEEVDEMYDVAVDLVTSSRKASISMVQRKLRVGYNRAARMIEMMERDGVVGPSDGRGGREVMAPPPPPL
jgi:S-DNA-T family DNA segregation ATPase FtsK/SpoIIIE